MNNTYFILSNKTIAIERLHICTWDFVSSKAAIELGMEFTINPTIKDVEFKLSLPFLQKDDKVICLMDSLVRDDDNSKFIFNDTIKANKPINGDKRNGATLDFVSRNSLSVLPMKQISVDDGVCSFKVNTTIPNARNYVRMYIQTSLKNLAVINNGIAKNTYIYDIKINERRNLPDHINELLNGGYTLCDKISSCFCFHVVPSQCNISYLNSNKIKNIRILESSAFNRYLPNAEKMEDNECLIVFNKSEKALDGVYTFFSEFEKETIGNKQIILAIAANVLCSLLFGLFSLRDWIRGNKWYDYLPWEFWAAIAVLLLFVGYLFIPWKRMFRFLKSKKI